MSEEEKANIAAVEGFIAAWNAKDSAKAMSYLAEGARFCVGPIGKTPVFDDPSFFREMIDNALSIEMRVTPGSTVATGPVVMHERFDRIQARPDWLLAGKYIGVFALRDGKIVDFLDYDISNE